MEKDGDRNVCEGVRLDICKNIFAGESIDLLRLQFTDLFGYIKTVEVTRGRVDQALREGCAINRYALEGLRGRSREPGYEAELTQSDGGDCKLYLRPDVSTLRVMGWESGQEDIAGVICDVCERDHSPAWADPRSAYKRILEEAGRLGLEFSLDFQCEFYLFHTDEEGRPTTLTHEVAGYYDAGSIDLAESVRRDMMLSLREAGMEVESAHHGLTPGQHCFLLPNNSGLAAADYLSTFRAAVKRVAKRHGLHATFMPKPNMNGDGSGLHTRVRVRRADGKNEEETLRYFRAGILRHLRETMIFTNPLVNSYKRLAASGHPAFRPEVPPSAWECGSEKIARLTVGRDGTECLDVLYPDPSANPYLALGALIAAGTAGVSNRILLDKDEGEPEFPRNLGEAIRECESGCFSRNIFGEKLCGRYLEERKEEWDRFSSYVTDWETREYLYRC